MDQFFSQRQTDDEELKMIPYTNAINCYNQKVPDPSLKKNIPRITWQTNGQIRVCMDGIEADVKVFQCFPWSGPSLFISLRDFDDNEITLIENINDLDVLSRQALEKALIAAGFVLEIVALESVEEDFEIRNWKVLTLQGKRTFQTLLDDSMRKVPGNGVLIEDVAGDLFYIRDPEALDKKSQKLLWAFLD
jgi:hypothetical protein